MEHKIPLRNNWFKIIEPDEFNNWIDSSGIQANEWDFTDFGYFGTPIIMFAYEKDAVAFRLRYGL